jgi:hypothetical protein
MAIREGRLADASAMVAQELDINCKDQARLHILYIGIQRTFVCT